jgi:hypothetical protein
VIWEGNRLLPTPLRFSSSSIRRLPRLRSFPPESFLANPCCLRGELTTGRRNPRSGSLSRGGWISAAPLVILRGELLGLSRFGDVRRGSDEERGVSYERRGGRNFWCFFFSLRFDPVLGSSPTLLFLVRRFAAPFCLIFWARVVVMMLVSG